ncbi:SH3 domain-containing protein [Desulfobacterales bacterium HSG17]|nr:SH3 domain-containing protein [Desulfobacterales bacterium HSG17]
MKIIYHKYLVVWPALFLMLFSVIIPAAAGSPGTVLSVMGTAFVKASTEQAWNSLKKGTSVQAGDSIKVESDSFVRLLTPKGSIMKIASGNSVVLNFAGKKPLDQKLPDNKKGNFTAFVNEFFSPNTRTRINAVRSILSPLQQDWLAFSSFDSLSPDRIEAALELSAAFHKEKNMKNRSVFILWKLSELFPENEGLQNLSGQAVSHYKDSGKWDVKKDLQKGEVLTISYISNNESFVYLFKTVKNKTGDIETIRIFPQSDDIMALENEKFFASRIAPKEVLFAKQDNVKLTKKPVPFSDETGILQKGQIVNIIKEKGLRYLVQTDDNLTGWVSKLKLTSENPPEGIKSGETLAAISSNDIEGPAFVWGYSSLGPLSERIVKKTIFQIEDSLKKAKSQFNGKTMKSFLPVICRNDFFEKVQFDNPVDNPVNNSAHQ